MLDKQLYKSNYADSEYFHNSTSLFLKEVYDLMKECYGPYGSHIMINGSIRPEATKDGKTILSNLKTDGSISKAIHGSIMNVANKQVEEVGDGSTSTILLLCKLYESFSSIIEKYNISPSVFNRTLKNIIQKLLEQLKHKSEKIVYVKTDDNSQGIIDYDKLYAAIHTSVDGDTDLATKILDMFKDLNCIDPLVLIEMSQNEAHRYELVKGVETQGTIIRPEIFFNGLSRMEYEDPIIVVVNGRMDMRPDHFVDLATSCVRENKYIIFLATGISQETLEAITTINTTTPGFFTRVPIFQIRDTANNEEFKDLCVSLGATFIDSESFKKVTSIQAINNLIDKSAGHCSKALVTEFCARFNDPKVDEKQVSLRIDEINERIEEIKNDPSSYNDRLTDLENRKAFLSRHYAKFYVGGYSPQRKAINYELANDGIPQAISCMKYGIVEGCNVVIPNIISEILISGDVPDIESSIYKAIANGYLDLTEQLIKNKNPNDDENYDTTHSFNLRNEDISVINSADTDRAILENATDMAALLATSKGFLSTSTEYDVVNKKFNNAQTV